MKKLYLLLIALAISVTLAGSTYVVCAGSGCCSRHGGVNCSAGKDTDGSVICKDGWRDSSCDYSSSCPLSKNYNHSGTSSNNDTRSIYSNGANDFWISIFLMLLATLYIPYLLTIAYHVLIFAIDLINKIAKLFRKEKPTDEETRGHVAAQTGNAPTPPTSSDRPHKGDQTVIFSKPKICPKCGSPMYKKYTSKGTIAFCRKRKTCGYRDYSSYFGERPS